MLDVELECDWAYGTMLYLYSRMYSIFNEWTTFLIQGSWHLVQIVPGTLFEDLKLPPLMQ